MDAGELQLRVFDSEDPQPDVGKQGLRVDPVDVHVLEAFVRIVGALANRVVGLARGLVLFELLARLRLQADGPSAHAVDFPGVAIFDADHPGRAVAQPGRNPALPGILGLLHVVVGGDYIVASHFGPPSENVFWLPLATPPKN